MPARAATWTLEVPTAHLKPETETITDNFHGESVIGPDFRDKVNLADIQDGGQFRSIVKIQSKFRSKDGSAKWMMGSGWLIRPDLLVTAGHVVYDKAYGYGAVTQIKCYIGYNGVQSVPKQGSSIPAVQPRYGSKVVTTESWIVDGEARPRDVAFIQVHKDFVGSLNVFNFTGTPSPSVVKLGVVGYPGDKDLNGEFGAQMYELFGVTSIDLDTTSRHMITYNVSTAGGQSGAPILSQLARGVTPNLIAIGTHCYGAGNGDATNSGNSIGGEWGNDYNSFISLFGKQAGTFPTRPSDITYVIPGVNPKPPVPAPQTPFPSYHPEGVEEGFLDVLKTVARIGASVLPVASSLLGPVGSIVGIAAGGLLGAIAGQESTIAAIAQPGADPVAPGVAERAVLAEASLQAVISLLNDSERVDRNNPVVNKVLAHMSDKYMHFAPNIDTLSTRLAPQLTECALDIASQRWTRAMAEPRREEGVFEPLPRKPLTGLPSQEGGIDLGEQGAFVEGLISNTCPFPGGEEGAFDFLGPLITKAVSAAKPLVSKAAKAVITDLLPKLVAHVVGSSTEATLSPVSAPNAQAARLIFQRALVADTAASALASLSSDELKSLMITLPGQGNGQPQQEGVFDFIKSTIQKIGPFALKTAKGAIKRFAPVLIDVAADTLKKRLGNGDISSGAAVSNTKSGASLGAGPSLKRKPSSIEMYRDSVAAETVDVELHLAEPTFRAGRMAANSFDDLASDAGTEFSNIDQSPATSLLS
ncbi:ATP synthase F1 [Mycena galericulata]|nr:ATP synthase F1 [Mycena galericulata]